MRGLLAPDRAKDAYPVATEDLLRVHLAVTAFEKAPCQIWQAARGVDPLRVVVGGRRVVLRLPDPGGDGIAIPALGLGLVGDRDLPVEVVDAETDVVDPDQVGVVVDMIDELIE